MCYNEKAGIIKLSDFGMASVDDKALTSDKLRGNPAYMAPEQFSGTSTSASDIWSLGVIAYESLTGRLPYRVKGKTNAEVLDGYVKQTRYPLRSPAEVLNVPAGHYDFNMLSNIIMKCLAFEPSRRPSADQVQHILATNYLYSSGFGPTQRTVAAYIDLVKEMPSETGIVVSDIKLDPDTNKALTRTLHVRQPISAVCYRHKKYFQKDFIEAITNKEVNPCLRHSGDGAFVG